MNKREFFISECALATATGDSSVGRIAQLVASNQASAVQHSVYFAKPTGGASTIRMSDASDLKTIGVSNLASSKMGPNQLLLITGMRLLGVTLGAAPTVDTIKSANYGSIKGLDGLQNGEMDVYSGGKLILKDYPLSNFITDNRQSVELGTIALDMPKFFYPDQEVKVEIRTGSNPPANSIIKVEFIGVGTAN